MNNVLIVDQSEILRLKVRSIISSPDTNVLETGAVNEVKNDSFAEDYDLHNIDLVILDIQFGAEEDLSLLNYLQQNNFKIPVLILSSNDRRETVLKAYRLGAQDYLLKPFDESVLKAKVNDYLENKEKKLENSQARNDIVDYFKFDLLEELSRSLRGESNFDVLKLVVDESNSSHVTKNLLLSLMRGIDRIYKISDNEFLILLPLTDKEGGAVLFERINDYLEEHLVETEIKLANLISFPEDITDEVEGEKIVNYQNQIMYELFDLD